MRLLNSKTAVISLAMLLLLFAFFQTVTASPQPTIEEKSLGIMSDVFTIDLSKYQVIHNGTNSVYPSAFGQDSKQVVVDYTLVSGNDRLLVNLVFVNDLLWYCNIYPVSGFPIYSQTPAANSLDQIKDVLYRYQKYVSQYSGIDASYITAMAKMLNGLTNLKSDSVKSGNIVLNISDATEKFSDFTTQTLTWVYTENGVDVHRKSVTLEITNNTLISINDSWNIVSTDNGKVMSEDEALSIAWNTIQNCTFKFVAEDGSIFDVKPELSHIVHTETSLDMVPKNSTVLYPIWQVRYLFDKSYYGAYGIQVGIWGDNTKEVAYCQPLITLGDTEPTNTGSDQMGTENVAIMICLVVGTVGVISAIFVVRKKK